MLVGSDKLIGEARFDYLAHDLTPGVPKTYVLVTSFAALTAFAASVRLDIKVFKKGVWGRRQKKVQTLTLTLTLTLPVLTLR